MEIDRVEASYRVVTPMFSGGARPAAAELRLASFKGVLRWWWRALAWSRHGGELSKIKAQEDALFGSAARGQGKVVMRLLRSTEPTVLSPPNVLRQAAGTNASVVGDGARYLGYGVMEAFGSSKKGVQAGQLTRACLQAPFDLHVELRCRDLDAAMRSSLLDALRAVGLLGGLGAKSRKGYGGLVLQALVVNGDPSWSPPNSPADLAKAVKTLYPNPGLTLPDPNELPPYTTLSSRTRHVLVQADGPAEPLGLLDRVGRELMRYRSWGRNGKVLGSDSEKNFEDDHDLMKTSSSQRNAHPRRIVFGLPHNYGKQADQQVGPAAGGIDRRASPLLIHVHECETTPVAVVSFLPAEFLPQGYGAQVNVGGKHVQIAADEKLWKPIHDLLDRFLDPSKRKEPFGATQEVRP
jgi:CRISPR-associated protein Cmr1